MFSGGSIRNEETSFSQCLRQFIQDVILGHMFYFGK